MDKPSITCNNAHAGNDLSGVHLNQDIANTIARPPSTVLNMEVRFSHAWTSRLRIGFVQARIMGYFKACTAETLPPRAAFQGIRTVSRRGGEGTARAGELTVGKVSLKIEREPARTTERHFVDKHMTYAASRDGAEPLWEFWPDQGHNFLQVQRLVRIRVVFDRKKLPYGFCKGVVRTECKRYVRTTPVLVN